MGEVFAGRYELIDPIASGGMGTVWRVVDHTDGEIKAAKMLKQADAAMLLRFVREQSVRVAHTHVVTPQSWAGVDDRVLFTMPLVRGGSVATLLKKYGALPPRWVALLLDQTLQALEAVHRAGIVHRDIKPGNLLLEPTGRDRPHLRLTDFGIAVPADEPRLTHVSMVIGTPGYMAPEQYHGADPDPAADIYAAGRVAQEMLTGTRPSRDPGEAPDPAALRTGDPAHDAVLELVAAATATEAADRPDATALRADPRLQRLLALPADPHDGIAVLDDFPPLPHGFAGPEQQTAPMPPPTGFTGPGQPGPSGPPPPPPVVPAAALPGTMAPTQRVGTRPETVHHAPLAPPAVRRPGVLAPVLVLLLGVVGLGVAGWLLLG